MKKPHILFAAALVTGLGFGLPARAEPPPWAPAHGYRAQQARSHRYVYYPERQVYYAPDTRSWFWLNGANIRLTSPAEEFRFHSMKAGRTCSMDMWNRITGVHGALATERKSGEAMTAVNSGATMAGIRIDATSMTMIAVAGRVARTDGCSSVSAAAALVAA